MSEKIYKFTTVLITKIDGKQSQVSRKVHCPACGSQRFTTPYVARGVQRCTCARCGRHLNIGILLITSSPPPA